MEQYTLIVASVNKITYRIHKSLCETGDEWRKL